MIGRSGYRNLQKKKRKEEQMIYFPSVKMFFLNEFEVMKFLLNF